MHQHIISSIHVSRVCVYDYMCMCGCVFLLCIVLCSRLAIHNNNNNNNVTIGVDDEPYTFDLFTTWLPPINGSRLIILSLSYSTWFYLQALSILLFL